MLKRSDILSVEASPTQRQLSWAISRNRLPYLSRTFDCIVLTQTLQYIFDIRAAVATLFRSLKPGGILLLTVPSVRSQIDGRTFGGRLGIGGSLQRRYAVCWRNCFTPDAVTVDTFGNIFVATAFHFGIALEELTPRELGHSDSEFPVIVVARAVKQ